MRLKLEIAFKFLSKEALMVMWKLLPSMDKLDLFHLSLAASSATQACHQLQV